MPLNIDLKRERKSLRRAGRLRTQVKYKEYVLWIVPIFLVFLAGLLIASTQRQVNYADWYQHWITAGIGISLALIIAQFPINKIRTFLIPIYFLTLISLIAVKFFGTSALGAQRWLNLGGLYIQPSEFAKITVVITLASLLDHHRINKPLHLVKPIMLIIFPWLLVFLQPDLGTSLVFGAVLLTMLYWSGMPLEWAILFLSGIFTACLSGVSPLALIVWIPFTGFLAFRSLPRKMISTLVMLLSQVSIALCTPWLWMNALKDYQRDRLILFLDPTKDPLGGGYHLLQSTIGIGSGGFWGTGLLQGQLTKLRFVPEQHTDFIFSALGEETGFVGTSLVVLSFLLLMSRLLKIANEARTDFESLVVIGIGAMLMFQVVVNIFMTIGLGPVTGIPLPFMSYGRTAMIVNFLSLGICLSVARRGYALKRNR